MGLFKMLSDLSKPVRLHKRKKGVKQNRLPPPKKEIVLGLKDYEIIMEGLNLLEGAAPKRVYEKVFRLYVDGQELKK